MELLSEYSSELMIGGGTTFGALLVAILKAFAKRLRKIESDIVEMDKKIDINTALDKERQRV